VGAVPTSVAIDVGPTIGSTTGIGRFVTQLVDALGRLDEPPAVDRYVLSFRATLPAGVRRLPFPAGLTLRAWGRGDRPRARRALRGAEVVHGTNYVVPPSGLPSVVTVHDCSFVTRPDLVDATVRRFEPVVRRAIARGAWVHAPSAYVGAQAGELLRTDRVRVVPHGPPPAVPVRPGLAPLAGLDGRPYILAIGTREPRKNLPRLVDAFGLLHPTHPEVDLLTDWVSEERRADLLRRAAVLAYPSLDEGFGFPLLEAMQLGVPVVASQAGAIPEVAAGAAILVPPQDTVALADALGRAISDSDLRTRLVAAGTARVGAFSWDQTAAALNALYGEAAMEGSS
jgi:glycosyltransferase involved in cell wall biosynthesis